jgi:hypothetical protein
MRATNCANRPLPHGGQNPPRRPILRQDLRSLPPCSRTSRSSGSLGRRPRCQGTPGSRVHSAAGLATSGDPASPPKGRSISAPAIAPDGAWRACRRGASLWSPAGSACGRAAVARGRCPAGPVPASPPGDSHCNRDELDVLRPSGHGDPATRSLMPASVAASSRVATLRTSTWTTGWSRSRARPDPGVVPNGRHHMRSQGSNRRRPRQTRGCPRVRTRWARATCRPRVAATTRGRRGPG